MAKGSRNTPATNGETKTRKPADQIRKEVVGRVRKIVRKAVARLNSAEVKSSGNPAGNWELLKSWDAFDKQLAALVSPPATAETPAAQ